MTTLELDRIFAGRKVPSWLRRFESDPDRALEDLLLGGADLGHLEANEPSRVLLNWLEGLGAQEGFVEAVDEALERWIGRRWGEPVFDAALGNSSLVAAAWIRAAELMAFEPRLIRAARRLRSFLPEKRPFLGALSEGPARDPKGRAWLALARHQEDRSLLEQWWQLCTLPPDVPWYHGEYGIHGLRGLPREKSRSEFPNEVAEGLARLATAFAVRAGEGWLRPSTAREEFLRLAKQTEAAYPWPEDWISFWRNALQGRRVREEQAQGWIRDLHPKELKGDLPAQRGRRRWHIPNPDWAPKATEIAVKLGQGDWNFLAEANKLLRDQEHFAKATGDTYNVVRTACYFASEVRTVRPDLALEWSDLARRLNPWDAFAWTTRAATLLMLRRPEALTTSLEAVKRFPENVVARNGLGEVLKAQGRLDQAETIYRETTERFPQDVVARTGLGETLKAQGRLDDAESIYRDTVEWFPQDVVAQNGLGEVLKAQGRLDQAEDVYRQTIERFPENVVARNGLGEVLKAQGRLDQAEDVYRQTIERFPENVVARNGLGEVLKAQGRLDQAEDVYRQTVERFPENVVARNGLGGVLKAQGSLDAAEPEGPKEIDRGIRGEERSSLVLEQASANSSPTSPEQASSGDAAKYEERSQLRADDIEILLQDTYLLRRWAGHHLASTPGQLQENARRLLRRLSEPAERDSEAAGSLGLLELDSGELDRALDLLRSAARRFPGSTRVRYALARAEREAAARRGHLDTANPEQPARPWRHLSRLDERFRPLQLLGEGRTWLVQTDGSIVAEHARDCFGGLGFWIHDLLQGQDRSSHRSSASFLEWWAKEVQSHVFGRESIKRAEDISDLSGNEVRLRSNSLWLDRLEEDWVGRLAVA